MSVSHPDIQKVNLEYFTAGTHTDPPKVHGGEEAAHAAPVYWN